MNAQDEKLVNSMVNGLGALLNAHFENLNERIDGLESNQKAMLAKQDITNGRVNKLENWQEVHKGCELKTSESFVEVKNKISDFEKKNGKVVLWFSEKPLRLLIIVLPIYLVVYLVSPEKLYNLLITLFS